MRPWPSLPPRLTALPLVLAALLPSTLQAQSAAELIRRAAQLQTQRLARVENVRMIQSLMGMESTLYLEKRLVGGTPALVPVSIHMMGMSMPVPEDQGGADWATSIQEEWANRARLAGREEVDGRTVHVLAIDDFDGLIVPAIPGANAGEGEVRPASMRFSLDTETLVMRRMEMSGHLIRSGAPPSPVEISVRAGEYREVEGYLHPFRTEIVTRGALAGAGADAEEIRGQLEELRRMLESMPEQQRAMMEGMLRSQLESLEAMLGDGDTLRMVLEVRELRVNAGPP